VSTGFTPRLAGDDRAIGDPELVVAADALMVVDHPVVGAGAD
jgi:hypothetical protein